MRALTFFAAICLVFTGLAGEPAWAKKKKKNEPAPTSDDLAEYGDAAVGKMWHERLVAAYGIYDDDALGQYVQQIGSELAARAPGDDYTYHFTIIDMEMVNAFALPGGYIYITRGLLALLNSEGQLAAVLGHEIGHVAARHAARQQTAAKVVGKVTGRMAASSGATGFNLGTLFGAGLVRGYGRDMELEADQTGAELVAQLGYDPQAMLEVIAVLKARDQYESSESDHDQELTSYHAMLSSHPEKDRRTAELVAAAGELRPQTARGNGASQYLQQIDGLAFAGSAAQGVTRDNNFYHAQMNFALTFPDGWSIDNLPDRLITRPPSDDATMQVALITRDKRKTRRVSIEKFLQKKLGIRRWQNSRTTEIDGKPAFLTHVPKANTPYGERLARVAAIFHGDSAFVFSGATQDGDRQRKYDREFVSIIESMRSLRGEELALAQPVRVTLMEATDGTRFADLESEFASAAMLRLLNGHYPDGEPAPGDVIKVIR